MSTRRRPSLPGWRVLCGLFLLLLLLLALAVILTTSVTKQAAAVLEGPRAASVPGWTRPCWRGTGPRRTRYTPPCALVHGRVLYRELHDPDGDGDRHLVVVGGARLLTLKIPAADGRIRMPGIGSRVTAVGRLADQTGRFGLRVVDVARLDSP